jgi:hypothetical protein
MRNALEEAYRGRNESHPDCELVIHRDGAPIVDFRKAWNAACTKAEVKWLRFHDLRRSAVRNMDRAGIPRASDDQTERGSAPTLFRRERRS